MEIQINELVKIYGGETVVNVPSLTIKSGEIVGLVGNNGAGKTTLMRLMLDLIKADGGCVRSNGQKVCDDEHWKDYTGSFIDGRFLIDFYTPEEYFGFIADVYKISDTILRERLEQFDRFMNGEILGKRKLIRNFSEGNRQKIGIIGAMIIAPQVLILDEPFNYLDPSSQMIMASLLQTMNKQLGTTIVVSSHNLEFVNSVSTRILLMEKGKIMKDIPNQNNEAATQLNNYFMSGK
ncbi:MAG: ABC transporter ATP-binding protein [Bacteroidales bacterium]|nr:ABC transporter ATP-binding protein [Bacteroidales bacterium]